MDPLVIYVGVMVLGVLLLAFASTLASEPTRACPQCGDAVKVHAKACRHCHYRFG